MARVFQTKLAGAGWLSSFFLKLSYPQIELAKLVWKRMPSYTSLRLPALQPLIIVLLLLVHNVVTHQ